METTTIDPPVQYVADINGRNYLVDEAANRIQFLDSRFYEASPGVYVPSVTTVLDGGYPKSPQFLKWLKENGEDADTIRDEAGRRGSVVHNLTEAFDRGAEVLLMNADGTPKYKLREWSMLEKYVDFRRRHSASIHAIETNMASAELGYAGTLDRVLTIDGVTYLMDIKTSGSIHETYWLQQAAYHNLLHVTGLIARLFPDTEVPEIKPAILWLNANTRTYRDGLMQGPGWQFIPCPEETSAMLEAFNGALFLYRHANKNDKPRFTSYQLKHSL